MTDRIDPWVASQMRQIVKLIGRERALELVRTCAAQIEIDTETAACREPAKGKVKFTTTQTDRWAACTDCGLPVDDCACNERSEYDDDDLDLDRR